MGLRLTGERVKVLEEEADRLSAPVGPGAVQVAGGGLLLVLGVAGGTMGGYAHGAHVISIDLDRLAQLRPGERVRFARVSVAEAREIAETTRRERARRLRVIRTLARDDWGERWREGQG
jgi:antagonist of KipI